MKKAFSLVELLVVIGIMGMMATLAISSYTSLTRGMNDRAALDLGKSVAEAALQRAKLDRKNTYLYLFDEVIKLDSEMSAGIVAGVACVFGHMFPFYLKFRGGKGFASYLGMALALHWKFALVLLLAVVLITLVTDYIVLGTMTTVISFPAYCAVTQSMIAALILCAASLVIIYKHRSNLVRICHGTEIGLRSAHKGEHRVHK